MEWFIDNIDVLVLVGTVCVFFFRMNTSIDKLVSLLTEMKNTNTKEHEKVISNLSDIAVNQKLHINEHDRIIRLLEKMNDKIK